MCTMNHRGDVTVPRLQLTREVNQPFTKDLTVTSAALLVMPFVGLTVRMPCALVKEMRMKTMKIVPYKDSPLQDAPFFSAAAVQLQGSLSPASASSADCGPVSRHFIKPPKKANCLC